MHQTMRWFGPNDPVSLSDIRQAGCAGVVTALHQIPVGDSWTLDDIKKRKAMIEAAGMSWTVVESLPVSEDIKQQQGDYLQHIDHYKQSLLNLGNASINVVTYNFMPVLDWLRTDINYALPDGARALYFERMAFLAFDLFMLKRPGAADDYTADELAGAENWMDTTAASERERVFRNALLGLPGSDDAFTPEQVQAALKKYEGIDRKRLQQHLFYFLQQVIPAAENAGISMVIHPDDPPFPVLGLPRIVSTE